MSELRSWVPDIVHVHNLFPNFGTHWLDEWQGPTVATLHNFRTLCANGLLFRDERVCTECLVRSPWRGVQHGCYRGSRIATLPVALSLSRPQAPVGILRRADALITLNPLAAETFLGAGVSQSRLRVIPNAVEDPGTARRSKGDGWLVVGRLSPEKGIARLASEWPEGLGRLTIVGDGPDRETIERLKRTNVRVLGLLDRNEVLSMMAQAAGLLVPSVCLEMQPTVVTEALASGIPVVAYSTNASADLVREFAVGGIYTSRSDLKLALEAVLASGEQLRNRARALYEDEFLPSRWMARVESLYRELIAGAS
jgi:glycosyltransferase involved in cell wall biosynthesis